MKSVLFIILCSVFGLVLQSTAQPFGNWSLEKGDIYFPQTTIYGTKQVFASDHRPGGLTDAAYTQSGNSLYYFGGAKNNSFFNDLWEFDLSTRQWRWLSGSKAVNQRGVFGTAGIAAPTNVPGGRKFSTLVIQSDKLFLFGGEGYDRNGGKGLLNDVWEYNLTTQQWRFLKGSFLINGNPTYGALGVVAGSNVPGARRGSGAWSAGGKMFVFGGFGRIAGGTTGHLQDLWEYDPATNNWRWVKGSSAVNTNGVYGTLNTASPANNPGGRLGGATASNGTLLWLLGGEQNNGFYNDVWEYDPGTNNWKWIKGSNTVNPSGTYGTIGTAAPANNPGGRRNGAVSFADGKIFFFGGIGRDEAGDEGYLNDLWEFNLNTKNWRWLSGTETSSSYQSDGNEVVFSTNNYPAGRRAAALAANTTSVMIIGGDFLTINAESIEVNSIWECRLSDRAMARIKGSDKVSLPASYGTTGTFSATNLPQGKYDFTTWQIDDRLFVFGGYIFNEAQYFEGFTNQLWEYNLTTNEWRLLNGSINPDPKGVYGPQNTFNINYTPGGRAGATGWVNGNRLYLFGGNGLAEKEGEIGSLSDLWAYDLATGRWGFMKGSNQIDQNGKYGTLGTEAALNMPGGRLNPQGWVYNGKLQLFGGNGLNEEGEAGLLNDLWEWNPTSLNWKWINGSKNTDDQSVFGTKGSYSSGNKPGGRTSASTTSSSTAFLFGGYGNGPQGALGYLNQLWEYDPAANQWRWINGNEASDVPGFYGSLGNENTNSIPGGRNEAGLLRSGDYLYVFGGEGIDAKGAIGYLNDVWKFNLSSQQWAWVKGDQKNDQPSVKNESNPALNTPGSRNSPAFFAFGDRFHVYGGIGLDAADFSFGSLNDIWKLEACENIQPVAATVTKTLADLFNGGTIFGNNCDILAKVEVTGSSPITSELDATVYVQNEPKRYGSILTVQRHYDLTPTEAEDLTILTGKVTLYFKQSEFNAFNAVDDHGPDLPKNPGDVAGIANLRVTKFGGRSTSGLPFTYSGQPELIDPSDSNIKWITGMNAWEVTMDITGFSGFFVHTVDQVLPINFLSISAAKKQPDVEVRWNVGSAEQLKLFRVQLSYDGNLFQNRGTVQPGENERMANAYYFIDPGPWKNDNRSLFYRIEAEEKSGRLFYSPVVRINQDIEGFTIRLRQNPVRNFAEIQINADKMSTVEIRITDINGKTQSLIRNAVEKGTNLIRIPAGSMPDGIYLIEVRNEKEQKILKFLKQN
jgi:N-acetylneuraminic acid mutarotase